MSTSVTDISIKGPELTSYQKDILHSRARFTITEAGTKTGKTFSHIYWLFKQAHSKQARKGFNYWWVAPVYSQAKIAYNRMWNKVAGTKVYKTNKGELSITTPLGTIIHFKTAKDPDNLYGEDVHACVFDEFTRAKEEAWFALRSTLTATRAKCKLIGNYKGNANWGHQLSKKAQTDPSYEYFKITAWDAVKEGILDKEEVQQAQRDLPHFMFKALYLAEGDLDRARLINDDAINDFFTSEHVHKGTLYISADIATYGSDRMVILVWSGFRIIDFYVNDMSTEPDEIERKLRAFSKIYGIPKSRIVYDADGAGVFLKGYLKGARPFHNNGRSIDEKGEKMDYLNLKSQCYFKMAKRMNAGGYYVEANMDRYKEDIMEELEMVKNRSLDTDNKLAVLRKDEIKEFIRRSPDFSDAIMMREYFELKSFGECNEKFFSTDS